MEILAETTLWGGYIFALIITGLFSLVCGLIAIGITIDCIKGRFKDGDILGIIAMSAITIISGLIFTIGVTYGPEVEYTAIVSDYNEVFSQGYEIKRHEGKLVILTKEGR